MPKKPISLSIPQVIFEIETVLETYPEHPYQQAFASPEMRQKLITHTLLQFSSFYSLADERVLSIDSKSTYGLLEQKLYVHPLIRQGIQQILQDNTAWVSYNLPQAVKAS